MRTGIETKVAASSAAGTLAVTIAFAVLHWLAPTVATPPAYIVGGLATLVTLAAEYFAPHTHLRTAPGAIDIAALNQPAEIAVNRTWAGTGEVKAATQPSATGTGTGGAP